ncbi:hypothetical protein AciM339_0176 [Aciduliprofundum sp. MAR08-339]|uniref:hypothetical protein n=1 Tax=Aciduliprofundum sp. (strain MAR08-339) TaxID=673860 RepID=UPI0002A49AD8|nr:hypothetical protein AciM339_0176 [Aciduliprofundum sp. MAR08-339]
MRECPYCGANDWEYIGFHGGFKEYRCKRCGGVIAFDYTDHLTGSGQKFLSEFAEVSGE